MRALRTAIALFLALQLQYACGKPTEALHNAQHDHELGDQDSDVQNGAPVLVHEVSHSEKAHHSEGDGHLNHHDHVTEPDQQLEEYDTIYYEEEEDSEKPHTTIHQKRSGVNHHIHAHKNHTDPRHRRSTKSSEEELEPLSADHVPHKRSSSTKLEGREHSERKKRSSDQGIDEDGSDGSFDGLEYDQKREKRSLPVMNHPGHPEETVEMEDIPQFPSDMHRVDSVAFRVKRVNKAGSSHRNRLINKNKGNSKAGQTEEQSPSVQQQSVAV